MSEDSSEFKPLPRRNSKKRKPRSVGASTPSSPRRATRARTTAARAADGTTPVPRSARRKRKQANPLGFLKYVALLGLVGVAIFVVLNIQQQATPPPQANVISDPGATPIPTRASLFQLPALPAGLPPVFPTAAPTFTPTPTIPEVAIVAGHWVEEPADGVPIVPDSGAVCPDGLREVDITKSVADKVLDIMRGRGYHAVLLQEFDPLYDEEIKFKPRVFLSIHADSCLVGDEYAFATGYKIAHAEPSNNEQHDARLVICLTRSYDKVAVKYDKPFNANTITRDMTEYHAFRKIDPLTPAAIIELGFLGWDREFLVNNQDEMARALAIGLDDFIKGNTCVPATATPAPTETVLP